jgi:RNA polymerase sigma factor (sigma-70 family)
VPDDDGFCEFVSANLGRLRRLAYLTCRDWHAADDAVAVALPKLHGNWASIDNPYPYAARAVVNAATDEVRRPWRREEHPAGDVAARAARSLPDHAAAYAERAWIEQALRDVPAGQRTVLVLRYYRDCSVAEVATLLRLSPGTVKSQTARGLRSLERILAA